MTKNEKQTVINGLAEQLQQYAGFYLTDISALNAEQTANNTIVTNVSADKADAICTRSCGSSANTGIT